MSIFDRGEIINRKTQNCKNHYLMLADNFLNIVPPTCIDVRLGTFGFTFSHGLGSVVLVFLSLIIELSASSVAPAFLAEVRFNSAGKRESTVRIEVVSPASLGGVLGQTATEVVEGFGTSFTVEEVITVIVKALVQERFPPCLLPADAAGTVRLMAYNALEPMVQSEFQRHSSKRRS